MKDLLSIIYTQNPLQYWYSNEKYKENVKELLPKSDLISDDLVESFETLIGAILSQFQT
jgi:hypothetical protein